MQKLKAFSWSPSISPQLWLPNRSSMKVINWHSSGQREGLVASEDCCRGQDLKGSQVCPVVPITLKRADVAEAG